MEYVASLSYGKDSIAMLYCIRQLGFQLDRILHAEIWATDTIPADLPEMVAFKEYADPIIERLTGLKVEHIRAPYTFEDIFYRRKKDGDIYGWPGVLARWCTSELKTRVLKKATKEAITYIGIAKDEPARLARLKSNQIAPLYEYGWTEADAMRWCQDNNLVSPIYNGVTTRGGCWFCHLQRVDELRQLRHNHPELWHIMLEWDEDCQKSAKGRFFKRPHTLADYDNIFWLDERR